MMDRRSFVTLAGVVLVSGCLNNSDDTQSREEPVDSTGSPSSVPESKDPSTDSSADEQTETSEDQSNDTGIDFDAVVDYSVSIQDSQSSEYDLPEPTYDGWSWLVMDLTVTDGVLDMSDVWFNAFFETEERLLDVAHASDEIEYGIKPRGSIRKGGRGIILHEYPPSPASSPVGWNTSPMDQEIGGDGVITDGPHDLYPDVTLEYSVETTRNPDIIPDKYLERRGEDEKWAIVSIDVVDGHLNMEDVWFRSQLITNTRIHDLSHVSSHAERGIRSRGKVKPGNTAKALYLIGENETIEEWSYNENVRQNVSISRS